jgi:hypothetical protein
MKTVVLFALAAALVTASTAGAVPPFAALKQLYVYDANVDPGYRDAGVVESRDGIVIHDISFASPRGGRVTGYLVLPPTTAPAPLILWSPGLGGTRDSQLEEARLLAKRGAASFLIDPPSARPGGEDIYCSSRDRRAYIQQVVDLRRAIDVVGALPRAEFAGPTIFGSSRSGSEWASGLAFSDTGSIERGSSAPPAWSGKPRGMRSASTGKWADGICAIAS